MPSTLVDLARRVAAQAPVADELAVLVELDEDEAQDAHGRGDATELEDLDAHVPAAVGAVEADHGRHAAAREVLHLLPGGADDARRTDAPARGRALVGLLGAARAPPGGALLLGLLRGGLVVAFVVRLVVVGLLLPPVVVGLARRLRLVGRFVVLLGVLVVCVVLLGSGVRLLGIALGGRLLLLRLRL